MKRIISQLAILALFVGCTEEYAQTGGNSDKADEQKVALSVEASIENFESFIEKDVTLPLTWKIAEQIGVFADANSSVLFKAETNGIASAFSDISKSAMAANNSSVYSFYPSKAGVNIHSQLEMTVPSVQVYANFDNPDKMYLGAKASVIDGKATFSMKQMGAVLGFGLKSSDGSVISKMTIETVKSARPLAGTSIIDLTDGNPEFTTPFTNPSNMITVNFPDGLRLTGETVYVPVGVLPFATLGGGIKLIIFNSENKQYTETIWKGTVPSVSVGGAVSVGKGMYVAQPIDDLTSNDFVAEQSYVRVTDFSSEGDYLIAYDENTVSTSIVANVSTAGMVLAPINISPFYDIATDQFACNTNTKPYEFRIRNAANGNFTIMCGNDSYLSHANTENILTFETQASPTENSNWTITENGGSDMFLIRPSKFMTKAILWNTANNTFGPYRDANVNNKAVKLYKRVAGTTTITPKFNINAASTTASSAGGEVQINVISNVEWQAEILPSSTASATIISGQSGSNVGQIKINIAANSQSNEKKALVRVWTNEGVIQNSHELTITQDPAPSLYYTWNTDTNNINVGTKFGTYSGTVVNNGKSIVWDATFASASGALFWLGVAGAANVPEAELMVLKKDKDYSALGVPIGLLGTTKYVGAMVATSGADVDMPNISKVVVKTNATGKLETGKDYMIYVVYSTNGGATYMSAGPAQVFVLGKENVFQFTKVALARYAVIVRSDLPFSFRRPVLEFYQ